MAAPIGNLFGLGNNGGRPPIHDDPEKVKDLIIEYFEYIQGEKGEKEIQVPEKDDEGNITIITKTVEYWIRQPEPPTITGISIYLGFADKTSFYEYKKKEGFSYYIKTAATLIEKHHEEKVAFGDKCVGNIFVLKNMGWTDRNELTLEGGDKPISTIDYSKLTKETLLNIANAANKSEQS